MGIALPVPRGTVWNTYTISSWRSWPLTRAVTVKAQAGRIGTFRMLDHLRPGMTIKTTGPAAMFPLWRKVRGNPVHFGAIQIDA